MDNTHNIDKTRKGKEVKHTPSFTENQHKMNNKSDENIIGQMSTKNSDNNSISEASNIAENQEQRTEMKKSLRANSIRQFIYNELNGKEEETKKRQQLKTAFQDIRDRLREVSGEQPQCTDKQRPPKKSKEIAGDIQKAVETFDSRKKALEEIWKIESKRRQQFDKRDNQQQDSQTTIDHERKRRSDFDDYYSCQQKLMVSELEYSAKFILDTICQREERKDEKYGILNVTELYKRAIDPSNKKEIKEIDISRLYLYETSKKQTFRGMHWTEDFPRTNWNVPSHLIFRSPLVERKYMAKLGLEKKITRYTYGSRDSNCYHYALTDGKDNGKLTTTALITALRDSDSYPIAGGSRNGNHPNPGWSSKGYRLISSSDGDPIITSEPPSGRIAQHPQKEDLMVYWERDTATGEWSIAHAAKIRRVTGMEEDKIYVKSIWGSWGLYGHLPFDILPIYGEAYTIYHSDAQKGPLLKKSSQQPLDHMSSLQNNDFHVIASSDRRPDPTSKEQPCQGDLIVYWLQNPHTQVWSPFYSGNISRVMDGQISVRSSRDSREHPVSTPGFPFTKWEICRIDPPDSTDPGIGGSTSNRNM